MRFNNISKFRLLNQQIGGNKFKNTQDLVCFMGAMQAQDYNMAKWAIAVRVPGTTDDIIEELLNKGKILRTHILRPTWHFVSADDIYWMTELTAPIIKRSMKKRDEQLGLTSAFYNKCISVIEPALTGGKYLTKEEIIKELKNNKISVNSSQLYHLLLNAELDGIICSGSIKDKKQSYALLAERVVKKKILTKEEALAELAKRYFFSRGPATVSDFTWWSSLSVKEAKMGIHLAGKKIISKEIDSKTFYFSNEQVDDTENSEIHLLPAFDEFLISYRDRSPSIPLKEKLVISNNGIFRPIIVMDGQVIGIWKRSKKKDELVVKIQLFQTVNIKVLNLIEGKIANYGKFYNKRISFVL